MRNPITTFLFIIFLNYCSSGSRQRVSYSNHVKNWIKGEGIAQIYQDDISLAKDRALRKAKKDAVKRKLGELIKSKTVTDSGVWVKGEVSARSEGLVKNYIIFFERRKGDVYEVSIKAHIIESAIKERVEELISEWERPIIYTIVEEKFDRSRNNPYDNTTTQEFTEYFLKQGFVINKTSNWDKSLSSPITISKVSKLTKLNKALDFDLLLFGSTKCKNLGKIIKSSKLLSSQVDINLTLFDINTKSIIATSKSHSAAAHISFDTACINATSKAMKSINSSIFNQMLKKWDKEYSRGKLFILELKGNYSYKNLYDLENDLREKIRGSVDVIEKSYSKYKSILHIIYQGQGKDLAQELVNKNLILPLKILKRSGRKFLIKVGRILEK